jgi:hypothetical protein
VALRPLQSFLTLPTDIHTGACDSLLVDNDKTSEQAMKNQKLTLLVRAKMSTLNAIRVYGDTDAEEHFQKALDWLNRAINLVKSGVGGEDAHMINATSHLQLAARMLEFDPQVIRYDSRIQTLPL